MKEEQEFLWYYCKCENAERRFITMVNKPDTIVCTSCGFTTIRKILIKSEQGGLKNGI